MGLFDNLFKTKASAASEEIAETKGKPGNSDGEVDSTKAPESAAPALHKPPVIPPPQAFGQRSLGHVITPGHAQRSGLAERRPKADAAEEAPQAREIAITLGDVFDRLPAQALTPGPHDMERELRFELGDLAADIARGRAAIPLSQIAAQCPDLFLCPISEEDDVMVRLPLQKLVDQIGPLQSRSAPAPPPMATGEAVITLRLAAILRTCPREIIVGETPAVSESETIKFPFAPIERQLPNGRVDVSSMRFVAALPPHLRERFRAIEGVRVPLPLDEIFLNLPAPRAMPPVPASPFTEHVVLAPIKVEAPEIEMQPVETPAIEAPVAQAPSPEPPAPADPASAPAGEVSQAEIDDLRARIAALRAEIGVAASVESAAPPVIAPPLPRLTPAPDAVEPPTASPIFRSPLVPPVVVSAAAIEEAKVEPPKIEPPSPVMLPVRPLAPPVVRPHVAPPRLFSAGESVPLAEVHAPGPIPVAIPEPEPLPPPAPLSLDLEPARAALALEGVLSFGQLAAHLAALPGLQACVLDARHESAAAGAFPAGLDAAAVRARCAPLAGALAGGDTQHLTLFADPACISLFARGEARLAVLHRARVFLPGVGEKLHAAIEALARA